MARNFGTELHRVRRQAGWSLRGLAERVGVDFTYLSKIETRALPPPAAPTIDKLARALRQPPEAWLRLAGKVPNDLSAILLKDEHIPTFLRAATRQRLSKADWEELTRFLADRRNRPAATLHGRFADAVLVDRLIERLAVELPSRQLVFVEMCGMHGHALVRAALDNLLDGRVRLRAGPGCSSTITGEFLGHATQLARRRDTQLVAYPELMLEHNFHRPAWGKKLRVESVLSPHQAVQRAAANPRRKFVLLAAGFETTVPSVALAAIEARRQGIENFLLLTSLRSMIAAIREVTRQTRGRIQGLIAPGHVSAIVGLRPFRQIACAHRLPIVVVGFEIPDILYGLLMLIRQVRKRQAQAENQYGRVVQQEGNPAARRLMTEVFETTEASWEGLGKVPESIFRLRPLYRDLDAAVLLR